MKRLSKKEEEIMELFWQNGAITVSEIRKQYPYPRPHMNTISTQVRLLESNGFLAHEKEGKGYRYHAIISRDEYSNSSIGSIISHYYENSYMDAVSALVNDDKITVEELEDLVRRLKQKK
ncbi:MAG: BlaI/MecI/CopY family transcriptional regulator [Bacteroidetes bacterium]|nr:BlaI/MecI/CopY family transcriptional regulator [Candidatus Colenecus caballi]